MTFSQASITAQDSEVAVATQATVVVPCFNEEDALPHLFERLDALEQASSETLRLRFLFVDDASSDQTPNLLTGRADFRDNYSMLRHETNRGITAAIMTGIRATKDEVVCTIDADSTYDPLQLLEMISMLTEDVDLVTASPYHPQGVVEGVPGWRLVLSRNASRLYRLLLRNKLHTSTSCCRVYRRSKVLNLAEPNDGFVGVTEMLLGIDANGGKVLECPAHLSVRRYGQSKMRTLAAIRQHVWLFAASACCKVLGTRTAVSKES